MPWDSGLNRENPDRHTSNDQRHRHERLEAFLTGLGEVSVIGMLARVLDDDRLAALRCQPDESLSEAQFDPTHRFPVKSHRGTEPQAVQIRAGQQIDRTDVGVEALGHEVDDVAERLIQVVGARDDLGDIGQECDAIRNDRPPAGGRPCPSQESLGYRIFWGIRNRRKSRELRRGGA